MQSSFTHRLVTSLVSSYTGHEPIEDNKYVSNYCFDEYKEKTPNNIIDLNDKKLNKLPTQSNFQYYQNHEFYKLS